MHLDLGDEDAEFPQVERASAHQVWSVSNLAPFLRDAQKLVTALIRRRFEVA